MNVYQFTHASELLTFLDQVWQKAATWLPVYAVSDKSYAVKVDDVQALVGLEPLLADYSHTQVTLADDRSPLSWPDLLPRLRPFPWRHERPFSAELLIVMQAERDDFERLRDYLFDVEYGSSSPFLFEVAVLEPIHPAAAQPHTPARQTWLLRLRGLHAYAPMVDWLADEKKYEVYYPYWLHDEIPVAGRPAPSDRAAGIYVQWGYELPLYQGVMAELPSHQLFLLRAESPWWAVMPPLTLHPILHVSQVSLSDPTRVVHVQSLPLSDTPAFQLRLKLRPRLDSTRNLEHTEAYLLERISALQFQLERLRLEKEDLGPDRRLYVYEEEGHSLDALREYILQLPAAQRSACFYARCAAQLGDVRHILHVVIPSEFKEDTAAVRARLRPDYEFYLNRELTQITRCKVYLPIQDGRRLELFPSLFSGNNLEAERMRKPLLGDELAEQGPFQQRDLLLLWPLEDNIVRLFLEDAQQLRLDEAYASINTLAITRRAQVIDHALPQLTRRLDQSLGVVRQDLDRLSQTIDKELQTAWHAKQGEIDQMLTGLQPILAEAQEVDVLAQEIRSMAQFIRSLHASNLDEWYAFVAKVCEMHQVLMNIAQDGQQRSNALLESVRQDVQRTAQAREREITEALARIQSEIENLTPDERWPEVAQQLRSLAEQLE